MPVTQHLLDWNQPLLQQVADQLLQRNRSQNLIDLSHLLVVVPTSQSRRRLLETLALSATQTGNGLLSPDIRTPDALLAPQQVNATLANDDQMQAAWVELLERISLRDYSALFPVQPERTPHWCTGMAQRLMQLRNELGEEGMNLRSAAARTHEIGIESQRWQQLADLEERYLHTLEQHALLDPKEARAQYATTLELSPKILDVILVATPDPQALSLRALEHLSHTTPIQVWIYADELQNFDSWGRPLSNVWATRPLQLENWDCELHTHTTPQQLCQAVAQASTGLAPEAILFGCIDSTLEPELSVALNQQGMRTYSPEGTPLNQTHTGRLCELLCDLLLTPDLSTLRSLLQHPDLSAWLDAKHNSDQLLAALDRCFTQHLCNDLQNTLEHAKNPDLRDALRQLNNLRNQLTQTGAFSQNFAASLQAIYQQHQPATNQTVPWHEQALAAQQTLQDLAAAETSFPNLKPNYLANSLKGKLRSTYLYPDRPQDAHDLLGWLELLWNDAPHLELAGFNEGIVPESIHGDAFLPENMRTELGLRTNEQRFARDAYLLEALCRRRTANAGRIRIHVTQTGADGSPQKPSRILFNGAPDTLIPRTQRLFNAAEPDKTHSAHQAAWRLSPPADLPMPQRLSVSSLKSYLECPFRFFLRHILKMQPLDTRTRELSPAAFGTLFHDTVSELKGQIITSNTPANELNKRLQQILNREITQRYGNKPSFALRLQREALLARLNAFAEIQIKDCENDRIEILNTESPFTYEIQGITIRGTIDRIDRHGANLELIDYKTADSPKTPTKAHLTLVGKKEPPKHLPQAAYFEHNGKQYRWTDLQLPLYVLATEQNEKTRPTVSYFNLAKTLEKSSIDRWEDFSQSHLESAHACASSIIKQIQDGIFWPPNPDVREAYDDFAPYFPDGIENSVNPADFTNYQFSQPQ